MSRELVLLLVLAGTAAVPVISTLVVRYQNSHTSKHYDERQELARGQAFRVGAGMMLAYFLALFVVYGWQGLVYDRQVSMLQAALAIMVGLVASLLVVHTCCILTHAALPLGKKPQGMMLSYFLMGALELANYGLRCWMGRTERDAAEGNMYLILGVGSCYLGVLYFIEWRRRGKEERDGEE